MGMSTKDERLAMSHPESFIAPDISDNGLLRAATRDATVWLYARIPWSTALLDGANDQKRTEVASSMLQFFNGLANMVPQSAIQYRTLLKDEYREFHILTGSMVENYHPPLTDGRNGRYAELARYQTYYYRQWKARRQFAVIGVPLKIIPEHSTKRKKPLLDRFFTGLDRAAYNLATGHATFDEYMPDAMRVENIMRNAGFQPFTRMDANERERLIAQMETWWVSRANASALPIIAENDHVHFFPDGALCQEAKRLYDEGKECEEWGIDNEYPACMCFARTSNFEESLISDPMNLWIAQLMEASTAGGANAVGVSIRGKVEPAKVTQDTLRRNQHAIDDSIRERQTKGREATMGMEELQQRLAYKRSVYSVPDAPPSIIDLSIAACVAGNARIAVDALSHVPRLEFVNLTTANEQLLAFKSMQACSPIRMTPYEMHWTATTVAGGGVSSFATAGDKNGALLGLTEANRQPVYIGTTTVQDEDRLPFMAVIANSGAGKTMALFSLCLQWSKIQGRDGRGYTPCVYINPKEGDDLVDATESQGGRVVRLDSDVANGTFDPLNVLENEEEAKETAAIMLSDILHPNGADPEDELALTAMLDYGIKHGAKCCGIALHTAAQAYVSEQKAGRDPSGIDLPPSTLSVYRQVSSAIKHNQNIRLIFGTRNDTPPLKLSQGLTLISAGSRSLVPTPGSEANMTGRIQQWVLRMVVLGAGAAVRGRDGMVCLDEAWVAMGKGSGTSKTLQQWGRMARSQRFTPVLASQKVQEFIDAGLTGAISRAILMSLDNPVEDNGTVSPAKSALRLLQIEDPSGRMLYRMGLGDTKDNKEPNWQSLRRLVNPNTGETIRGAVCYFKDGSNQPIPVEIIIPPDLLKEISTTATAKIERQQRKKAQEQS